MENINQNNYEAWLLDYAEGNLSAADRQMVEAYLDDHPQARAELEAFDPVYLSPEAAVMYPHKEALKKESGRGRVVYFNYAWRAAAVAAVLLAAVAALFPLFVQSDDPGTLTAFSEVPLWQIPAIEGVAPKPAAQEVQTAHPGDAGGPAMAESGEKGSSIERESPVDIQNLKHENIASISTQREYYYYSRSSVTAGLPRSASELNHTIETEEVPQQNNGLINNILNTEVARAFVPEALEDELPEASGGQSGFAPTIYVELPTAGKKLVDKFLK